MNMHNMQASAEQAAGLMRILGNEKRLMILCHLVDGERSVNDLVDLVGARQTAVSQQLAIMRREGLVSSRREGQTIFYALANNAVQQVLEVLYRLYCLPETPGQSARSGEA